MKGIVFTEFLEMVEKEFGYEMVDKIISQSDLQSNGAYTAIGTYPHTEMVQLLTHLSSESDIDTEVLLREFGKYIFGTFLQSYPQFFENAKNTFQLLSSIDNHIHVEVMKLYPDAQLPKFKTIQDDSGNMILIYTSERKMSALAEGLILRTIQHYEENLVIKKEFMEEDGSKVRFTISFQ
jgi:hypothetical protein